MFKKEYYQFLITKSKIFFLINLFIILKSYAQDLNVTLINNTIHSFPISNISSIKFESGAMILKENDGTLTKWSTPSIINYSFSNLNINQSLLTENNDLLIYPNPANNKVNIKISANFNTNITIEILDVNGRLIEQIFKGNFTNENVFLWENKGDKGFYFCRVVTENKTITKPLIIL